MMIILFVLVIISLLLNAWCVFGVLSLTKSVDYITKVLELRKK